MRAHISNFNRIHYTLSGYVLGVNHIQASKKIATKQQKNKTEIALFLLLNNRLRFILFPRLN